MILLYLLAFLFYDFGAPSHDIHISKAEIHYKSDREVLQVSLHIFLDDLEAELKDMGGDKLYLCTEKESEDAESYLMDYIEERFILKDKNQFLELTLVGKESSEDLLAVWCYLQVEEYQLNELYIQNKIMTTRYADQKNIVSFKVDGKREAFHILDVDLVSETLYK